MSKELWKLMVGRYGAEIMTITRVQHLPLVYRCEKSDSSILGDIEPVRSYAIEYTPNNWLRTMATIIFINISNVVSNTGASGSTM